MGKEAQQICKHLALVLVSLFVPLCCLELDLSF